MKESNNKENLIKGGSRCQQTEVSNEKNNCYFHYMRESEELVGVIRECNNRYLGSSQ